MKKNKILDMLIIIFLYIGISCIPFSLLSIDVIFIRIFQIIAQILIFFLIKLVLKNSPLKVKKKFFNSKNVIWFVPAFLVCFSNFFCLLDPSNTFAFKYDKALPFDIVLTILLIINEECIFRVLIIDNIEKKEKPIVKVLLSAAIFSLCHLTQFFSTFNPMDLLVVLYTFGIGIILGLIYVYTNSVWCCVIFHFAYNLINGNLSSLFITYGSNYVSYILINVAVGVVVGLYLLIIYLLVLRKQDTLESAEWRIF